MPSPQIGYMDTKVAPDATRVEIEKLLRAQPGVINPLAYPLEAEILILVVLFEYQKRRDGKPFGPLYRVIIRLKIPAVERFDEYPSGRYRAPEHRGAARKQYIAGAWRVLLHGIKAKWANIEAKAFTFRQEFLPHFVVPGTDGSTVEDWFLPQLDEAYKSGSLPPMLPGLPAPEARQLPPTRVTPAT